MGTGAPLSAAALAARYGHLLEQIDEAVLLVDPASGAILEVSPRAVELMGVSLHELIGTPLGARLASPAAGRLIADVGHLAPEETRTIRRLTLTTGRHAAVDVHFSVLAVEGEPLRLHVVLSDVTELRRLENALAQRDDLLVALASLAALARAESDEATPSGAAASGATTAAGALPGTDTRPLSPPEPLLERALAAALDILQAPAGALYLVQAGMLQRMALHGEGENLPKTLTPATLATQPAVDLIPLAGGEGLLLARLPRSSPASSHAQSSVGTEALRNAVAACLTAVASAWQARARARAAASGLSRLGQQHDVVLAHVSSGVLILNAQGRVLVINECAARLLGYDIADVVGLPYRDVLVTRRPIRDAVDQALAQQIPEPLERLIITRDAREVPVRLTVRPVETEGAVGALVVLEDLSLRPESDNTRRDLDRLNFLAEISPVLAHEMRNPLAAIQAGVQYMATKLPDSDPLHESVTLILDETRRLNTLFTDFLAAARPNALRLRTCQLRELLDGLLARRTVELQRRNITVHRQYEDGVPPAWADRGRLEQVFANLLDNALQAMGQDGVLTVHCGLAPGDGTPRVQAAIGDSGPGIAPDALERIFQPFFTTKKEGTGLGLPISRRIVSAHNGMLAVQSFPGVGTIFTVTLPAAGAGE